MMNIIPTEQDIFIDICLSTYLRPDLLKQALQGINAQILADNIHLIICVADNDKNQTAHHVIKEFTKESKYPVLYAVQPIQNIALCRNKAVSLSNSEFIAFIDDDEIPDKIWVSQLLTTLYEYQADVTFGPVIPIYDEKMEPWIIEGGFFARKRHKSGTKVAIGITANALLKRELIKNIEGPFDPSFGLTGGEDYAFFDALYLQGYQFIWSDDAIVREKVIQSRQCLSYLFKDKFRKGKSNSERRLKKLKWPVKIIWFVERLSKFLLALIFYIIQAPISKVYRAKATLRVASTLGHLANLFKHEYKHYQN